MQIQGFELGQGICLMSGKNKVLSERNQISESSRWQGVCQAEGEGGESGRAKWKKRQWKGRLWLPKGSIMAAYSEDAGKNSPLGSSSPLLSSFLPS